jgi:hypothetical protein
MSLILWGKKKFDAAVTATDNEQLIESMTTYAPSKVEA